jgi:hypothetical protein
VGNSITFRRLHPGGGPLGRCSYGVAGVNGIVVFDMGLFVGGVAPTTITLSCELAEPQPRKVAAVTSAVVAATNTQVAQVTGAAIASPKAVAGVVAQGAKVVLKKAVKA